MEKLQPGSPKQEKPPPRSVQKTRPRNTPAAPESDKDSGYSDVASECLSSVEQTDTEEGPPSSHRHTAENARRSPPSHTPSLVVLKDLLVDQGSRPDPHVQSWTARPSFQLLPTSSQILVFPPSLSAAKSQPICKKSTKYLPILNSYTKIAPHPSQLSSSLTRTSKRGAATSHHSQAKRLSSALQRLQARGKATSAVPDTNVHKAVVLGDDGCELSLATTLKDTGAGDPLTTDREDPGMGSSDYTFNEDEVLPAQQPQNNNRRFQNTLDILRRSGLLSIAMKTKELARLNQATQVQLERLQEQVALYTKAICSNNPEDLQMLQDSLTASNVKLKVIDMSQ